MLSLTDHLELELPFKIYTYTRSDWFTSY